MERSTTGSGTLKEWSTTISCQHVRIIIIIVGIAYVSKLIYHNSNDYFISLKLTVDISLVVFIDGKDKWNVVSLGGVSEIMLSS